MTIKKQDRTLSKPLKKAINLLKKRAKKIYRGDRWDDTSCPIASAYEIILISFWSKPSPIMMNDGWSQSMIREFIRWHDGDPEKGSGKKKHGGHRAEFLAILPKNKP